MAKVRITKPDKQALNESMKKLFAFTGIKDGTFKFDFAEQIDGEEFVDAGNSTTADLDLYVNNVTGSDTLNDGRSLATPFFTIQHAIDYLPLIINHKVRIFVAAGVYGEKVHVDKIITSTTASSLHILGTYTQFVPTTGPATGTVGSQTGRIITATGTPGWTTNNFRGWFVRMLAGTWSGFVFPVAANTSGTFEIASNIQITAGTAFEFVIPGTIISAGATSADVGIWSGANGQRSVAAVASFGPSPTALGFMVSGCEIQAGRPVRVHEEIKLYGCKLTYTGDIGLFMVGGFLQFTRSVISPASGTGAGIFVQGADLLRIEGSYIKGNDSAFSSGIYVEGAGSFNVGGAEGLIVESWYAGMRLQPGSRNPTTSAAVIRNNRDGVVLSGPIAITFSGASEFTNNTEMGIRMADNVSAGEPGPFCAIEGTISGNGNAGVYVGSRCYLFISNPTTVNNNGIGIMVAGAHNFVIVAPNCIFNNNTTWGIACFFAPGGKDCAFNAIRIATSTAMSGNLLGDFSLDGGITPISLAQLNAVVAPIAKQINNNDYFNRLYVV